MKKRVLSFLVACLMVVSTFIISKPLVHVHAVDGEEITEWALPMNWNTGNKAENTDGTLFTTDRGWDYAERADEPWKFAFYTDVDAGTAYTAESSKTAADASNTSGIGPAPYIESTHNRWLTVDRANASSSWTSWYVGATGRWGYTSIAYGNNTDYMRISHKAEKYAPAVVFIAPEDGLYSFSELVTGTLFSYTYTWKTDEDGDGEKETTNTKDFTINSIATVRKNGTVLASFTPTSANPTKTLTGEIALMRGEELAFVFEQVGSTYCPNLPDANGSTYQFKLGETVVKKVGEYSESKKGATTELKVVFSNPETFTDDLGNVKLMGYDMSLESAGAANLYELERVIYATNSTDKYWVALDPRTKNTSKSYLWNSSDSWEAYSLLWAGSTTTGEITHVGGSQLTTDTGSAYVFTAPNNGTYVFESALGCCWSDSNKRYDDYTIMLGDGTELAYANNVGCKNKAITTITATATLEAGEQVIILKTPRTLNGSNDGAATVTITELDHVCANSVKLVEGNDATCVAGGTIAYYACSCGKNYVDADATTELLTGDIDTPVDEDAHAPATEWTTDETGHWYVCNNGCDEKLSYAVHNYATGTCVCGKVCPHAEYADGKCVDCQADCPTHDEKTESGACATCGKGHTHTVTADDATCKAPAICVTCGYEVAPINPENHGEISYEANGDRTHKVLCSLGCVIDENATCVLDENDACTDCEHSYKVEIAEDNFNEVFDSIYNGGETNHVAEGPAEGALDNSGAVQGEKVDGFTYGGFNLEMNETVENTVKLRHHIILADGLTVKVNGEDVALTKVSGNYYYFEVEVEIGKFSETHTITVGEKTVVTASVHSYMKTAFEADAKNPDALTDAQENLLKALYDWDYAVANAN